MTHMIHIVTVDAIQETIKALGLADQVNPSVFRDQLEQQLLKLESRPISPPQPTIDTSQQMSPLGPNETIKGEVRSENPDCQTKPTPQAGHRES